MSPEVLRAAVISLGVEADGETQSPLVSGTRSLLLTFGPTSEGDRPLYWGAEIRSLDGVDLPIGVPDSVVELRFWAPEVEPLATVGAEFEIWFGHKLGSGKIVPSHRQSETGEQRQVTHESRIE